MTRLGMSQTTMHRIATAVLLSPVLMAVPAAENGKPAVITLSCDGSTTDTTSPTAIPLDRQIKPIEKMDVVANLNERTVSFMGLVAPISSVDPTSIRVNGEQVGPIAQIASKEGYITRIDGYLDRVTGHMVADITTHPTKQPSDPNTVVKGHYDVRCKATTGGVF